ncbi:3'-5' exonuclease [Tomitella fengzijianii]|uniref:3'-5' exonuclease n=1 Tax=Tomitella fengzijianii TaxID=2597660 RepID=A0A516X652_9ACTN|nr:3'-5' exonuclease [Tomitella fengzijianii]QDQ98552.1 3'-5' exonuclease [Tomitella fengzijianii]
MNHWSDQPVCAFDLETTGPDPTSARIVTACVAMLDPARESPAPESVRTWLLDPGIPIPPGATAVHGISTEAARSGGAEYRSGYTEIRDVLRQAWDAGAVVVAFNASFDLTLMDAEGRRQGFDPLVPALVADPYVIDREMDRYRRGKRTLGDVCRHYGVPLDNSHEAQADAVAAAHLLSALVGKYPDLRTLDIVAEQTRWHAERQRSFAEYLVRNGRDASDVNGEWPIRRSA